jgi:hypothetical protein
MATRSWGRGDSIIGEDAMNEPSHRSSQREKHNNTERTQEKRDREEREEKMRG